MKYLLALLFAFTFVQAQEMPSFKNLDSIAFHSAVEKIVMDANAGFALKGTGSISEKLYKEFTNDKNELLYIIYTEKIVGENIDLEIPGEQRWSIDRIAAKYLTVFGLYKLYYNPTADLEKIQELGTEWDKTQNAATLRTTSQRGLWEIAVWR